LSKILNTESGEVAFKCTRAAGQSATELTTSPCLVSFPEAMRT